MYKKRYSQKFSSTFLLVVFFVMIVSVYIILQSSLAFFKDTKSAQGNIRFGSINVQWTTRDESENRITLTQIPLPDGPFAPGVEIALNKDCNLHNNGNSDMYLRVIANVMFGEDYYTNCFSLSGIQISDTLENAWFYDEDNNTFYYNQALPINQEISFITSIRVNDSGNMLPSDMYGVDLNISFRAEAIQIASDAYTIWNPPAGWVNLITG